MEKDLLLCIINDERIHWTLLVINTRQMCTIIIIEDCGGKEMWKRYFYQVIDIKAKRVEYYDSYKANKEKYWKTIRYIITPCQVRM